MFSIHPLSVIVCCFYNYDTILHNNVNKQRKYKFYNLKHEIFEKKQLAARLKH